uniref:MADS-box domain-containing protein n=1 Tax=Kalanchoe fedtschenkoi TaxID=63787 RepID=A0A7N0UZ11_KALFE
MARRGIKLELIPSISARITTFRKRKKSFFKKLNELKKLCEVDVCAFIKNPFDGKMEAWPSDPEAKSVAERFKNALAAKKKRYGMNQESYLRKNIENFANKLEKQEKKNDDLVFDMMVNGFGIEQAGLDNPEDLRRALGKKIKEVDEKIDHMSIDLNKIPSGSPLS